MMHGALLSRRTTLRTGLACAAITALPLPAVARTYSFDPVEIDAGVWMIEGTTEGFAPSNGGAICNIVLLQTERGAIVIDTGSTAKMGTEIRRFADQKLGGLAATLVTHHHPDHWFGNAAFVDRPILSLEACVAQCARNAQGYSDALYSILGAWMSGTTPVLPDGALAIGEQTIAGRHLRLMPLSGHTVADLAVIDIETGILIAGDLLFLNRAASFPDADVPGWLDALDQLGQLPVSGVVPGHGPFQRSNAALVQTRSYLEAMDARLKGAVALGLSPVEAMIAGPIPGTEDLGANPDEYHRSIVQSWAKYETETLPLAVAL